MRVDVDREGLSKVQPYGFLTLKIGPQHYQVWLAVDRSNWRSASILRRLVSAVEPRGSSSFSRLAGSLLLEGDSEPSGNAVRATLYGGVAGKITTGMELEGSAAAAHLWSTQMY
jgi:hypothetical protein